MRHPSKKAVRIYNNTAWRIMRDVDGGIEYDVTTLSEANITLNTIRDLSQLNDNYERNAMTGLRVCTDPETVKYMRDKMEVARRMRATIESVREELVRNA